MGVLYILAIKIKVLLYLFSYRKSVIEKNIKRSFPEKSEKERKKIKSEFYSYFSQLLVESLKMFHFSKSEIKQRFSFRDEEQIHTLLKQNKDVILVLGHYGNWEWGLLAASLRFDAEMVGIYKPLSSSYWDKKIKSIRSQFGATLLSMKASGRYLLKKGKKPRVIGIIADQTPSSDELNHWINFLNQKTPVFLGTEKLAKKLDCPVFFVHLEPKNHGYYEMSFKLITTSPKAHKDGEITRLHSQMLEHNINKKPAYWLWSHRRWKHQQK